MAGGVMAMGGVNGSEGANEAGNTGHRSLSSTTAGALYCDIYAMKIRQINDSIAKRGGVALGNPRGLKPGSTSVLLLSLNSHALVLPFPNLTTKAVTRKEVEGTVVQPLRRSHHIALAGGCFSVKGGVVRSAVSSFLC